MCKPRSDKQIKVLILRAERAIRKCERRIGTLRAQIKGYYQILGDR